jgi:hypothetical protein
MAATARALVSPTSIRFDIFVINVVIYQICRYSTVLILRGCGNTAEQNTTFLNCKRKWRAGFLAFDILVLVLLQQIHIKYLQFI